MYDWNNLLKNVVSNLNRNIMLQKSNMGYDKGGDISGVIPGVRDDSRGDDTNINAKIGEYVVPVEAMDKIDKKALDALVYLLTGKAPNNMGRDSEDIAPDRTGFDAGGGILDTAYDFANKHLIQPLKPIFSPLTNIMKPSPAPISPQGSSNIPRPNPEILGPTPFGDAAKSLQRHNQETINTIKEISYENGGSIDENRDIWPVNKMGTLNVVENPDFGPTHPAETPQPIKAPVPSGNVDKPIMEQKQNAFGKPQFDESGKPEMFQRGVELGTTLTPGSAYESNKEAFRKQYGFVPTDFDSNYTKYNKMMLESAPEFAKAKALGTMQNATAIDKLAHAKYLEGGGSQGKNLTDFATYMRGMKELHPEMTDLDIRNQYQKEKSAQSMEIAKQRGLVYKQNQMYAVYDAQQGNAPKYVSGKELMENQDRYLPTAATTKALNQTALIQDIRGSIGDAKESVNQLKTNFTAAQSAQLALALKHRDPRSAFESFWGSEVGKTLTPDQQNYVINLQSLAENAMAMRSVLGAGQGSDELRAAIMATIPGPGTPSKEFATKQLDRFEKVINRLERGVPKVPLREDTGFTGASAEGLQGISPPGGEDRISQAVKRVHSDLGNKFDRKKIVDNLRKQGFTNEELEQIFSQVMGG